MLADDLVLTTTQLDRRGLLEAADWLALPRVTYTCRTRVNDAESDVDLTFVGKDLASLRAAPRELMHLAGLAEARGRLTLVAGERWRHVSLAGRTGSSTLTPRSSRPWTWAMARTRRWSLMRGMTSNASSASCVPSRSMGTPDCSGQRQFTAACAPS